MNMITDPEKALILLKFMGKYEKQLAKFFSEIFANGNLSPMKPKITFRSYTDAQTGKKESASSVHDVFCGLIYHVLVLKKLI